MKTGFVYPGQGSQYVGMGVKLLEEDRRLADWFDGVCDRLDFPLEERLREGPSRELERTRVTQPAMFVVNHLVHRFLTQSGLEADLYAGHSLGEYNALVAAGRIPFDELLPAVCARGRLMDEQARTVDGGMAAVLKLSPENLRELCEAVNGQDGVEGTVEVALYNSPGQSVVSGSREAIGALVERASEAGALKAVELDVSGPWHSRYMEPVQGPLREALTPLDWSPGRPVVTNVSAAELEGDPVDDLVDQLVEPVRWVETVRYMMDRGVERFVEVGPGEVLTGLIKRIARDADADVTVHSTDTLEQTRSTLGAIQNA